jgi:5-methylcytosine-specific restriction protein A
MDKRIRGRRGVALRKRRLHNEPLCRMCKAEGRTTEATVPDHIVPLALGGDDVDSNIRCLCAEHHDQVTREEFGHRSPVSIGADGWPVG